jgi:hypothetical protein
LGVAESAISYSDKSRNVHVGAHDRRTIFLCQSKLIEVRSNRHCEAWATTCRQRAGVGRTLPRQQKPQSSSMIAEIEPALGRRWSVGSPDPLKWGAICGSSLAPPGEIW